MTGESSGDWSEWSTCSATCGNATKTRSKMCSEKNETETQSLPCPNLPSCESKWLNLTIYQSEGMYLSLTFSACQCDPDGSVESSCDANGACNCKENFVGDQCKECKSGFFEHPNCFGKVRKKEGILKYNMYWCISECKCSDDGAVDSTCDDSGTCTCKNRISGDKCDKCLPGHYSFPTCQSKYRINLVIFKIITM